MTKREAKRAAKKIVVGLIHQALAAGQWDEDEMQKSVYNDAEYEKVRSALLELARELFEGKT